MMSNGDTELSLSVVIPTHGRPELLSQTIASVMAQTRLPREVIVVDDLGDERTAGLLQGVIDTTGPKFRYIVNENIPGACGSRNLGAQNTTSNLIAFIDDDDQWRPDFLAKCVDAIVIEGVDFAITDVERVFVDGSTLRLTTPNRLKPSNVLRQRVYVTGSSFVIKKDIFDAVEGFDPTISVFNDWDIFIRLIKSGYSYCVVQEPLAYWIEHNGERITSASVKRADGIDHFLEKYRSGMSIGVRSYFLRLAFGIRKRAAGSSQARWAISIAMIRRAGLVGTFLILKLSIVERFRKAKLSNRSSVVN